MINCRDGEYRLRRGLIYLILFVVLMSAGGYMAYRLYLRPVIVRGPFPSPPTKELPADLRDPGVVRGEEVVDKEVFFQDLALGPITEVSVGQLKAGGGQEIRVVGEMGMDVLEPGGAVLATTRYADGVANLGIVDICGDGVLELLGRGSWRVPVSLLGHGGENIWSYGGEYDGVNYTSAGDIDGDGELEFVVALNGSSGVHCLDRWGKPVWQKDAGDVWHAEIVDTDGNGTPEIVHSNVKGEMVLRNAAGDVLSRCQPGGYFSSFDISTWSALASGSPYVANPRTGSIELLSFNGSVTARLEAPGCGQLCEILTSAVRLLPDRAPYFAAVAVWSGIDRSVLYVYDVEGNPVYVEVLGEECTSLQNIRASEDRENLLVAGRSTVWAYQIREDL